MPQHQRQPLTRDSVVTGEASFVTRQITALAGKAPLGFTETMRLLGGRISHTEHQQIGVYGRMARALFQADLDVRQGRPADLWVSSQDRKTAPVLTGRCAGLLMSVYPDADVRVRLYFP